MDQIVAWTEKYRPKTTFELFGNEEGIVTFREWLQKWTLRRKTGKACLLVGPPGVGKTTLARAAADDYGFRVVEMNASDVRTQKAIESFLAPATTSATLDSFSASLRGNMILMDEVDGVFGREDRGGLSAILSVVKDSPIPIVLTANDVEDERFDDLKKACLVIELTEIRPRLLIPILQHILKEEGVSVPFEVIKEIARKSHGDIRSAINDVQAMGSTQTALSAAKRTRELDERETLKVLFESGHPTLARRALNETEIPLYRDQLILIVHDILPYIYTSPAKLAEAYDALSRADMVYGKIGASRSRGISPPPFNMPRRDAVPQWNLLPIALNELALVGIQRPDNDVQHVLASAPHASQRVLDRYQYRLWAMDHLCARVARACHVSKRVALHEIVPILVSLFRGDVDKARAIVVSLDLEERDIDFLITESKTEKKPEGPEEILDPAGFKLPFMGKDKFIQLMRIGLSYDRNTAMFVVRRMDNLESIEESLSQIISKPVKFKRAEVTVVGATGAITKACYIDGEQIVCDKCEFVEECPTHILSTRKLCLCDVSLSDPKCYEEYVAKNVAGGELFRVAKVSKPTGRKRASAKTRG